MKFRGDYTIVGKMTSIDVLSPKATIDEIVATKKFTASASAVVDMGANPIKKVGAPVDAADAATKKFVEDTSIAVTVREVLPNFGSESITSKNNDMLLVGNAPGQIACADSRVANTPISDIECSLTGPTVYAVVQDALNSIIVSKDGGRIWTFLASLPAGFVNDSSKTDKEFNFFYVTATSTDKMVAWRKRINATAQPSLSIDGGKTWSLIAVPDVANIPAAARWIPARLSKPGAGPLFMVNNTTANTTHFIYRFDTITSAMVKETVSVTPNSAVVSAASFGDRLVMITSAGQTVVRSAANNYVIAGTLPQTGVTWSDIVALDEDTWIACSGANASKSYVAISTNYGSSWVQKEVSSSNISLSGINYNPQAGTDGTVVVTGNAAAYVSTDKGTTWTATGNYKIPASQSVTPVGAGFVAASTTANFEIMYDGKDWINSIEGIYSDMFFKTSSGWSKYVPNFNGDDYLQRSGGTVTGQIKLTGGGSITGIQMPSAPTDAASKDYVDKKLQNASRRGVSTAPGTTFNNMVRISQKIETVKLTIVAKGTDGTKAGRYYSEMVIVIDPLNLVGGKIQAESTEFAVISTGDLQITTSIPTIATSDPYINVSFTANRSSNLEVIVEIVDLEADGEVIIAGERIV